MQSKHFTLLALLLIGCAVVNAKILKTTVTTASFASAPEVVIDTTLDSDKAFTKAMDGTVFFAPGASNTINAWLFNWNFSQNTSISIWKRTLDSSLKLQGDDILIKTDIVSKIAPFGKAGMANIAFPTVNDEGKGTPDQLWLNILTSDATENTAPIRAQITNNDKADIGFMVADAIWLKDTFWVVYAEFNITSQTELGLFMQGVKAADGTLKWDKPIKIASLNNPLSGSMTIAGLNSDSDATEMIVAWKEIDPKSEYQSGSIKQTTITLADGTVADITLLRSDTESAFYYPSGVISSSGSAGPILTREAYTEESEMPTYLIAAFLNGNTTPKILEFTTPNNYFSPMVKAFDLSTGFVAIAQYSGESDSLLAFKTFDTTGAAVGTQKKIGTTVSNMHFFQDADGAIWVAYSDIDDSNGHISKSWLGKLIA